MAHLNDRVEVESILDVTFPVLNKGFVRLVDYMGDDRRVVQAARVSTGSGLKTPAEDEKLIHYLLKNGHTSPFEQVEFTFHVKLPIFVARQWIRHRTAHVNEFSGRYSEFPDEFFVPDVDTIMGQDEVNRQGRSESVPEGAANRFVGKTVSHAHLSLQEYRWAREDGVAKELARINLPVSAYTQWYWKIDLHNLFHFLYLRLDSHAQYEIRVYAQAIEEIVKTVVPISHRAWREYVYDAVRLSNSDANRILSYISGQPQSPESLSAIKLLSTRRS